MATIKKSSDICWSVYGRQTLFTVGKGTNLYSKFGDSLNDQKIIITSDKASSLMGICLENYIAQ